MNIGLLNEKITFQKNTVTTDSIGNHRNGLLWSSIFVTFMAKKYR